MICIQGLKVKKDDAARITYLYNNLKLLFGNVLDQLCPKFGVLWSWHPDQLYEFSVA